MDRGVMLLGAGPFLAKINVLAPTAMHKVFSLPNRAAGRTAFKQVGHNVPGNPAPSLEYLVLFSDPIQFAFLDHGNLPSVHNWDEQLEGQVERTPRDGQSLC